MRFSRAVLASLCFCAVAQFSWATANVNAKQLLADRPIYFEANRGQTDAGVAFVGRGAGYVLFAAANEIVISARGLPRRSEVVSLTWNGNVVRPQPAGPKVGVVNYFVGNKTKWRSRIPAYGSVSYPSVYTGIDLLLYGKERRLEFDFRIKAGTSPSRIRMTVSGAQWLSLGGGGELIIHLRYGELCIKPPDIYQTTSSGTRVRVDGKFALRSPTSFGFEVGTYDRARELVIDPILVYSTYLGGSSNDGVLGVAVDAYNRVYATGSTDSVDFPKKNARDSTVTEEDAFVTKFYATGTGLFYSTYLGGSGSDLGSAIAVDRYGYAYIVGQTSSANFPGSIIGPYSAGVAQAFAVKLSPSGSAITYARRFGGTNGRSWANAVAIDSVHNLYAVGTTTSSDFPTTAGVVQPTTAGNYSAFLIKLSAAGTRLWATYFGDGYGYGSGSLRAQSDAYGVAVDSEQNVYTAGSEWGGGILTTPDSLMPNEPVKDDYCPKCRLGTGWIVKLNRSGTEVIYGTYLGGYENDNVYGIALDTYNNAYVAGSTYSANFPVSAGAKQRTLRGPGDAFVSKLNSTGTALVYSTFLGGSSWDTAFSIAVNSLGQAIVVGATDSADFPVAKAIQQTKRAGWDAFVTKLWANGAGFHYSTFFGGSGQDEARSVRLDKTGSAYVGGDTTSLNFPTKSAYKRSKNAECLDGFVFKLQ